MKAIASRKRHDVAALVRTHQGEIWRYLMFLGCEAAQAEDLLQETFLAVFRRPPEQFSTAATRSYLRSVARNKLLMSIRQRNREPKMVEMEVAEAVWVEQFDSNQAIGNPSGDNVFRWGGASSDDSDSKITGKQGDTYLESLDHCLSKLNGRAKEVIQLCYRQGKSRAEIAEQMQLKEQSVKSLLRRTRQLLRSCIERQQTETE